MTRRATCVRLFDAIVEHIPAPVGDPDGVLQMLVATWITATTWPPGHWPVFDGTLRYGDTVAIAKRDGSLHTTRITKL